MISDGDVLINNWFFFPMYIIFLRMVSLLDKFNYVSEPKYITYWFLVEPVLLNNTNFLFLDLFDIIETFCGTNTDVWLQTMNWLGSMPVPFKDLKYDDFLNKSHNNRNP